MFLFGMHQNNEGNQLQKKIQHKNLVKSTKIILVYV